eukprot:2370701-Pleurochrysis_carterae.AAC.1
MAYGKRKRTTSYSARKRVRMSVARKPARSAKRRFRRRAKKTFRKTPVPKFIKNGALLQIAYTSHTAVFQTPLTNYDFRVFCNFVNRSATAANGVHDDNNLGTVVPSGYDLMYQLYDECRIYGSKVEVYVSNYSDQGNGYIIPYIYIEHQGNRRDTITNVEELRDAKFPGMKTTTVMPSGTPGSKKKLFKAWTEKMMAREDRVDNTFSKNDTQVGVGDRLYSYKIGVVQTPNGATASGYYMVKVTYNCKWRSPHTFKRDTDAVVNDECM